MKYLLAITFLLIFSCNSDSAENSLQNSSPDLSIEDVVKDESQDSAQNPISDSFPFPQMQSIDNCEGPPRVPEFCEWGSAAYDIVLLEVTDTSLIVSPSVDFTTNEVVEDCDGLVSGGFRIEGVVKDSVNGLAGNIVADVGLLQYVDSWGPQPVQKEDGTFEWSPRGQVGIKAGDVIGLTLHKHPTKETLGILGEHFFDINATDTVRFGELYSECGTPQPKDASGLTFEKLKEEIQKCEPSALIEERKRIKRLAWETPKWANLGMCVSNK